MTSPLEPPGALPPGTYTRDNLPELSHNTKAYLAQLKARAKARSIPKREAATNVPKRMMEDAKIPRRED